MVFTIRFVALLLMGIAVGVSFGHELHYPNKMALAMNEYFIVQKNIYQGFGRILGPIEMGAMLSAFGIAIIRFKVPLQRYLHLFVGVTVLIPLIIFGLYLDPVNDAVKSWSAPPVDWANYRDQWEWSHRIRGYIMLFGYGVLIFATLKDYASAHVSAKGS